MLATLAFVALYLLAAAGFATRMVAGAGRVPWRRGLLAVGGLAVAVHAVSLWTQMGQANGLDLGFFNALSLVTGVMALMVLLCAVRHPLENLAVFILPVAAIAGLVNQLLGTGVATITRFPDGLEVHVITSVVAFAVLGVAVVQSLLLAWQDYRLRHHQPGGVIRALPPLQEMEHLLFRMISVGFALLSVALATGAVSLNDIFAQHLVHKTVFSICAWAMFGVLLLGRWRYGWRGRTAIRWTVGAFLALLLAYFGTKLVLELILARGY